LALPVAIVVSLSFVGSSASAGSAQRVSRPSGARPHTAENPKVPWGSGVARFVPGHVVVVWKDDALRRATRALNARLGARTISPTSGMNVDVVRVGRGTSVAAAIRRYQRSPLVRFAEPDRIASVAAIPNDPFFDQQWALDNTGQLHDMTNQGGGFGTQRNGTADADV